MCIFRRRRDDGDFLDVCTCTLLRKWFIKPTFSSLLPSTSLSLPPSLFPSLPLSPSLSLSVCSLFFLSCPGVVLETERSRSSNQKVSHPDRPTRTLLPDWPGAELASKAGHQSQWLPSNREAQFSFESYGNNKWDTKKFPVASRTFPKRIFLFCGGSMTKHDLIPLVFEVESYAFAGWYQRLLNITYLKHFKWNVLYLCIVRKVMQIDCWLNI